MKSMGEDIGCSRLVEAANLGEVELRECFQVRYIDCPPRTTVFMLCLLTDWPKNRKVRNKPCCGVSLLETEMIQGGGGSN